MRVQTIFPIGVILLFALLALVACAPAASTPQPDDVEAQEGSAVLLVPIEYRDGRWIQDPEGVEILPCPPPEPARGDR